jgi:N-acetylmuramoyl-L-alanine amidase
MVRIVIDPGHGGTSHAGRSSATGGRGPTGLLEKDVTLDIARHVATRLGRGAVLTRTQDTNLTLADRAGQVAQHAADVFVSIHANSGPPGARGAEVWVHPEADAGSQALAAAIQRSLRRLGGRHGGCAETSAGRMAVLSPAALGRRVAACLIEVDYLSDPEAERRLGDPRHRAAIGEAIAGAIAVHVRHGGAARAFDADDFDDADQLDPFPTNVRAGDTRVASSKAAGLAEIDRLRAWSGTSPWTALHQATVCDHLAALITDPARLNQASTPLCGPSSFYSIWAMRDPLAFAIHAARLYRTGATAIGGYMVRPGDSLLRQDYAAAVARAAAHDPPRSFPIEGEWMLISALRNNEDGLFVWDGGSTGNTISGITLPAELVRWLSATGLYTSVSDGIGGALSSLQSKGYNAAAALRPAVGVDIVCLIGAGAYEYLNSDPPPEKGHKAPSSSLFPDHYVILTGVVHENIVQSPPDGSPIAIKFTAPLRPYGSVSFPCWSYGGYRLHCRVPSTQMFSDNFYGAIVATMRPA